MCIKYKVEWFTRIYVADDTKYSFNASNNTYFAVRDVHSNEGYYHLLIISRLVMLHVGYIARWNSKHNEAQHQATFISKDGEAHVIE